MTYETTKNYNNLISTSDVRSGTPRDSERIGINTIVRRIDKFREQYGAQTLHFACHAALPVVLNSEFLHLLRINFFFNPPKPLPYTAEADLLLSTLCSTIDEDLYEIEAEVRDTLLYTLMAEYGQERVCELATLLWQYTQRCTPWLERPGLVEAQQLTALNFLDSYKAKAWLEKAESETKASGQANRAWFVAMHREIDQSELSIDVATVSTSLEKNSEKNIFQNDSTTETSENIEFLTSVSKLRPDYKELLENYVIRSIQATSKRIQTDNDAPLSEQAAAYAKHVLDFGLALDAAWPFTRDLLLALAPKMEQAGYRDDWLVYIEQGIAASLRCADPQAEAELRLQAGHLHYLCSRFALAEQQFNDSLARFQACSDQRGQARTYNELAWLGHLQHQYAEAMPQLEKALALLDGEDPERATSYRVQGMIAIDQRRWEEAETFHRQALALFEQQGDLRRIAASLQNLAYALRGQNKFEEAIMYYEQTIKMLDQEEDARNLGIIEMNLGSTYYCLNEPAEALVHYKQAELIFNRLHDKLSIAKVKTGFGLGYLALKQYSEAENAFSISIQLFAELKDESLRLNATDGLVMAYLAGGQPKQAIALAEQALHELAGMINVPNYAYLLQSFPAHLAEARRDQK